MSSLIAAFSSRILFLIPVIPTAFVGTLLRCGALCTAMLALPGAASLAQAQDKTPARGFSPNGSYALTDLETINTSNGNMMLRIPLASLPPARGGLAAKLFLIYNSKLWDSRAYFQYDPVPPHDDSYTRNVVEPSVDGGWRYGYRYQLQLFNRYDYDPSALDNACNNGYPSSESYVYHWKLKMSFPDGAVREFRPAGFGDSSVLNDGYVSVEPNGMVTACNGNYYASTSGMTYYSTDGTYMRLFVAHDGDTYYGNNSWTLYMPDGTRVTGGGSANQRVYDRNENYIEIGNVTINGQAAFGIADQLGRGITISGSNGQDDIAVSGVGGTLVHTTVKWKDVWVQQRYRAIYDPVPLGTDIYGYINNALSSVERITLPAQAGSLHYDFTYNGSDTQPAPATYPNGLGELHSITLPTGAQATYTFLTQAPDFQVFTDNYPTQKILTYRQEYDGVAVSNDPCAANDPNCITETWAYSVAGGAGIVTAPDGGQTGDSFVGGLSYATTRPDGTLIERNWQNNSPSSFAGQNPNPYVKTEFVSIRNAASALVKTAIKDYNYDKNGNITRVAEYDWVAYSSVHNGSGSPMWSLAGLTPTRVTTTSYYNGTPDAADTNNSDPDSYDKASAPRLLQLAAASEVADATHSVARSEFYYDNNSIPTNGNLTEQKSWDSTKGGYSNPLTTANSVSVLTQYNQYGGPILTTDAKGNQTQLVYGPVGGVTDLYPTEVRTAYQTAVQRIETRQYDFSTGVVTSVTDADNVVSTATTYDLFGRPTLIQSAVGKPEETRTSIEYSDTERRVITRSSLTSLNDADPKLVSIQHYDQMGRVRLSRQLEHPESESPTDERDGIKVQTRYKYSGANSYQVSSHPYREDFSTDAPATAMDWTRAKADNGGRMLEARKYSGNTLPEPWGSNTTGTGGVVTTYDANTTTVTDQAGKVRRSVTDGLGRLARVDEPDANGNLDVSGVPFQSTSYSYDALDNLTTVTQGTQTPRSFVYDSLKRLTSAANPESGTITYHYDNNGNLTQKTDARGVVATYAYDALNRNLTVTYTNDPVGTPTVTRTYDGATNGKGRLWKTETANGSRTTINSYDFLSKPLSQSQQFYASGVWSQSFPVSATYDKAGHVLTLTYPSGHTTSYSYDSAGRTSNFAGNLGEGVTRTYADAFQYTESGAIQQERFGTDTALYHKQRYNQRGQLWDIRLSTTWSPADGDRGAIVNYYSNNFVQGGTGADNNGNLLRQEIYIPGSSFFQQNFGYDSLNRLKSVAEKLNGTGSDTYMQAYNYDRWGNRTIDQTNTWGAGINKKDFTVNTANNRLGVPAGQTGTMSYDSAGNLTADTYSGAAVTRAYDAENRMTSETQTNNYVAGVYTYNGDGQRVRRKVNGVETWQVYGLGGELLAEYAANAGPVSPQKEYGYRNGQLLISADASALPALPVFSDNFNDNSIDPAKWSIVDPSSPAIVSEQAQQLRITLAPNTAGYNGVFSNSTYDMRGKTVQVEVAQTVSQGGWSENYLQVVLDSQNYYLISVGSGSMVFRSMVNGVNDQLVIGYDQTALPYWRLRHDQTANTVSFETSSNGLNWTTRKTVTAAFSLTAVRFYLMAGAWGTGNGSPGAAKYDNFQLAQSGAPPAPVTNLALNKPATQISTYSTAVAGLAVDGNTNGNFNGNSVTHTVTGAQDWWQVDLGSSYALETIKVWNRTDCCGDRLSNFYVFVSDQPFSSYDLTATLNQAGVSNYYTAGQGGTPTFISVNRSGRYVRVQLSSSGVPLSLAEVEVMGSTVALANINWLVTDQLGTPRMIVDQSGALANVKRHDYLPFGEELGLIGGRTTTQGYTAADAVRQKFTLKERDNETGLDYFGARYYASMQGRFTSADPMLIDVKKLFDPQRINAYAYTRNNPLRFVDPDGADPKDPKVVVKRTDTTFGVQGKNADEAIKDANTKGASRHATKEAGETTWKYDFSAGYGYSAPTRVKGDGFVSEAKTTDVTVTVTITVDMPKWGGYSSATPAEQQAWDKYSADLKDHEEGHVEIAEKGATAVGKAVQDATATGTGKTPAQAINDAKSNIKSAQDQNDQKAEAKVAEQSREYDKKTGNGKIPREE